jgi:ABC-type branched-subunit amino acid transport system substrate-binding protein
MRKKSHIFAIAALAAGLIAGCGSSSSGGGGGNTGALTFVTFQPYSGPDASFGPELEAGCPAAARIIVANGGILGHKQIKCASVDTRGDPADAVPAATQMLASTSNLVGVLGPSSDEAAATVPRINAAHIPMFADTGQSLFDHSNYAYFWRITAPDTASGYAESLYAHNKGLKRAALVYGNTISSQGTVPGILAGFKKLGGKIVLNLSMALDQSSYRSEVERLINSKPDVIFNELDPQTAATFFSELKQLQGHVQPLISTAAQYTPWIKAVTSAIGASTLAKAYNAVLPSATFSGPAYQQYATNLLASTSVSNPKQWLHDEYSESGFDTVVISSLAMLAAHSTNPAVWNPYILKVTTVGPGATVVHTFAQGKALLAQGKKIAYIGPNGESAFDKWHNSAGGFDVLGYASAQGKQPVIAAIGPEQIRNLTSGTP